MTASVIHVRLVWWNAAADSDYPVPDGTPVCVRRCGAPDDEAPLAAGNSTDGRCSLAFDRGVEVEAHLEARVPKGSVPPDVAGLWRSCGLEALDGTPGTLRLRGRSSVGTPDAPVTFTITRDCFVAVLGWDDDEQQYRPTAPTDVEAFDLRAGHVRLPLGRGRTGADGVAHVRLWTEHDHAPNLSFWLPHRDAGVPERPGAHPTEWEWEPTRYSTLDDPERSGYWPRFRGCRLGSADSPVRLALVRRSSRLLKGNVVEYVVDGPATLARLEALIDEARKSIHFETMLFFDDDAGRRIAAALRRRARAGVEVRLLFDQVLSKKAWEVVALQRYWVRKLLVCSETERARLLEALDEKEPWARARSDIDELVAELRATRGLQLVDAGSPFIDFRPRAPSWAPLEYRAEMERLGWLKVNLHDHRKLVVVDGKVAMLGGQNVGSEYLYAAPFDPRERVEPTSEKWHDCACVVRGPAVAELQERFRHRWVKASGPPFPYGKVERGHSVELGHAYFPALEPYPAGVPLRILLTVPGVNDQARRFLLDRIGAARREVLVETPYFSSVTVARALGAAARRGIRVALIVPGPKCTSYAYLYAGRGLYRDMLHAGVEIYEYSPRMTHAKVGVIDDTSYVGSINLNEGSLKHHYEIAAVAEDPATTSRLRADILLADLHQSRRIVEADLPDLFNIVHRARLLIKVFLRAQWPH